MAAVNYSPLQKRELPGKYLLLLARYVYQALRAVPALIYFSSLLFPLLIFPGLFLIYLCLHCNPCPFPAHSIRNDMFFQIIVIPSLHYYILSRSCCLDKMLVLLLLFFHTNLLYIRAVFQTRSSLHLICFLLVYGF